MITQNLCTVFKTNLLKGAENFTLATPYTYKIALYDANATLGADTNTYTTSHEITGTGYTAGGRTLVIVPPISSGTTAFVTFNNVTWNPANFSANAALIYNATTGAAVAVLNFGETKTAVSTFTVTFPTADASNAIIRIS